MLPTYRTDAELYSIPKFSLEKEDIEDFASELKAFHGEYRECFPRSESRDNFLRYMAGQFSTLERKSIEPMALHIQGAKVRAMQRFISDVTWEEEKILPIYRSMVNEDMGNPHGVLIFDETGFRKKGDDSVGVAKQYCGTIGKVDNCQVGVFTAYASPHGYALLDKRLFMPEKWLSDDYKDKRRKCKVPKDVVFKTKPQLAADMFGGLKKEEIIPFKYVVADSLYGNSSDFISAIEDCIGVTYFVSMPLNTLCWLQRPVTRKKHYRYKGEDRVKEVVEDTEKKPISFEVLAKSIHNYFWYRRKVSEGTKGPIAYEFTKRRITLSQNGLPQKTLWLIIKRTIEDNPTYSYYISNAPLSTRLKTFVWLSGIRWAIEQCFEETKTELGMDHYEVRKYAGWNQHILTSMLAHFFLWHLKIRLGKKSASHYAIAA